MKKRKLNSKNPKYWKKESVENKPIIEKRLINDKSGVKIYAVFEREN
jgi:hypothetical protein|tara:strand:+ start:603 stop:743 length:141 start_codon:yes stop_codon:yes gene_type:complete